MKQSSTVYQPDGSPRIELRELTKGKERSALSLPVIKKSSGKRCRCTLGKRLPSLPPTRGTCAETWGVKSNSVLSRFSHPTDGDVTVRWPSRPANTDGLGAPPARRLQNGP
jgi:hypothetical protein